MKRMDRDSFDQRFMPGPYEQFLTEQPDEAARLRRLVDEGRRSLEQGDGEQARIHFVKALAVFPVVPAALTNLAALALHQDQMDQAWKYLSELFDHYPLDPSAHGVAMRYWIKRGSRPMAHRHGVKALHGLSELIENREQLSDPSVIERSRVILLTTLAGFEADHLITELYNICSEYAWDDLACTTIGIAFYNQGELDQARQLWSGCEDSGPADLYLMLLDLVREQALTPFRLDYQLGARLPSLDDVRQALQATPGLKPSLRLVPSQANDEDQTPTKHEEEPLVQALQYAVVRRMPALAVLEALHHVLHGTDEEGELALSILFFDQWPYLREFLPAVADKATLSIRIRLNAALYMLWTDGVSEATHAVTRIEAEPMSEVDAMISQIIRLQIALVAEDTVAARQAEAQARSFMPTVATQAPSWVAVLEELSTRLNEMLQGSEAERKDAPNVQASHPVTNVIPFPIDRGKRTDRGGS